MVVSIAIVGIGCRLPGGVHSADELWRFLLAKGDGMVEVPPDRWNLERFYDPDPDVPGRMYTRRGGFLSDSLLDFDPEYFGISPREASIMDPQQRLLLEVAQEALDDAGHAGKVAGRPVGVYVGGFTCDNMVARHNGSTRPVITTHTPTSGTYTMLSNRVSFAFDLRGPSMTIDTACSSSLVALHQAVSALERGDIEMALLGGVNAMLRPETFISMCKGRFLAADGRCKTFDKSADGYARGEGAGMVVLRPLQQALADGDRIYAVVRATGSNQDGHTSGITVPNPEAQAELIREVTAKSGIAPSQIGYVEAHGTGTAVGDPLEMAAIGRMLGAVDGRDEPLRVGSIKASVGHLEAAAGVASVIKAALTLYHRTIAPQAWLNELNPEIPFDDFRLAVPLEAEPFPESYALPAASVNGFGYGGSNAHAILVAPPAEAGAPAAARARPAMARVFPVSGRNDDGARAFAADLVDYVQAQQSTQDVDRLADALWVRRAHQQFRFAVPYADKDELIERLTELSNGAGKAGVRTFVDAQGPVFLLSGMGPQWWGMARQLLTGTGVFVKVAAEIDAIFTELAGWSLIDELLRDEDTSKATSTRIAQTGNFLVQAGLAAELAELGVHPVAIVGHSVGEVSAAYLSGMLSLREAVTVSYHRARLQALQAGTGGMLAIGLSETEAQARLAGIKGVEIAAVNSPAGVTLAGEHEPLERLAEQLAEEGVFNRALRVEVPYHSHLMEPILAELRQALAELKPKPPQVPLYSTVTGARVLGTDDLWGAEYWVANVRQTVRFAAAIEAMIDDDRRVFLEVGPHPVLSGNVRQILLRRGEAGTSIPTLVRGDEDAASLRAALAELYAAGALDAAAPPGGLLGPTPQRELPVHRFQRVTLWTEIESMRHDRLGEPESPVLPGVRTKASNPEWECDISAGALPWVRDHVVSGAELLPGTAYLDAALAAASKITGRECPMIEQVQFISPLVIGAHEAPVLRLSVDEATGRFTLRSRPADDTEWTERARGRIVDAQALPKAQAAMSPVDDVAAIKIDGDLLYQRLDEAGLSYGPHFRRIREAWVSDDQVVAIVDARVENNRHQAHPAVVDCALQCMAAWAAVAGAHAGGAMVPAAVRSVRQFGAIPDQVRVWVGRQVPRPGEADLVADITLATLDGASVIELSRVQFLPITPQPPVLNELEGLWYESVYEPLVEEATDAAAIDQADSPQLLFVVGAGPATETWVTALVADNPGSRSVMAAGCDPAAIAEVVAPAFHDLISVTDRAVTVVVCAIGQGERGTRPAGDQAYDLDQALLGPAALAGAAQAVQSVLGEWETQNEGQAKAVQGLVLTRDAVGLTGDLSPNLYAASVVGARRVLRNEYPDLSWRLLDIDRQAVTEDIPRLLRAMAERSPEVDEIALRDGVALSQTITRTLAQKRAVYDEAQALGDPERNYAIELPGSKLLGDLALREVERRAPGEGEIELRLDALELNYKDAMKVIGVLGEKELSGTYFGLDIGMSGVGVITRVGPGVSDMAVGEALVFGTKGMARRYVTARVDDGVFVKAHKHWKLADFGSTVPMLTSQYCVFHAAQVQPGEVVLVHGGAGGVGMVTIQAAKAAGARVIATASTPERREVARQMGADEVLDSRSVNFVDEVRRLTDGRGADVVISSAPGEIIAANLEVAAEFGRVVEVGKQDIFTAQALSLAPFEKNLSFISMDIDRMTRSKPELVQQIQREIVELVAEGKYRPVPGHMIPVSNMAEAFEMVVRSTHVGRVLLDFTEQNPPVKPLIPQTHIHQQASYLVTGGFGAFGLATANWLAEKGARTLVLVSRSGPRTPEQRRAVERLTAAGVNVVSEQVDMADAEAVTALIGRIRDRLPPLRGVFHTAGVVQDGPFTTLAEEAMRAVMAPKALGAVNLHRALAAGGVEVDYFVLYSSLTAVTGTVPQTSYAAANATLDTLAAYRQAHGLAATSVNWGALRGGGMAEASEEVARYLEMMGLHTIDFARACDFLDVALAWGQTQVVISDTDWGAWSRVNAPSASTQRFAELVRAAKAGSEGGNEVYARLTALPVEERVDALTGILAEQVASVLGIPAESVDTQTPLPGLGLDSLMAVELNLRIATALGVEISALEFTRGGGLASLSARLLQRMEEELETTDAQPPTTKADAPADGATTRA